MYIRTKNPITYSINENRLQQETGKLIGKLNPAIIISSPDYNFDFRFKYETETENTVVDNQGTFFVDREKADKLFTSIEGNISIKNSFTKKLEEIFYLGFIQQMAYTFNISPSDIEIIL